MKLTNCDQSFFKLFWKQLKRMKTYRHPVFLESSWTLATTWFFPKFLCCHPPRTLHLTLLTGSIFNCIGGGGGAALKALLNDMICYMFINPAGDSFTFLFIFFALLSRLAFKTLAFNTRTLTSMFRLISRRADLNYADGGSSESK